ncbi:3-deoxy-D-manno-octulosonic acid transferase [Mucilaginibacter sp. BT774]|uniref:3-deoxy-D-manno-octulosonic acid transferase n=1 Tax=Mucilaginibacter sp. BT774 TaxID=3062276 RepID=UPI0026760047|nr:glycosyltransferase N-terminal domain-containing protein [Mucilaginibacter sp. BT774]MDO3625510.1 glycosyltransferase N-terminal domain-containing protein [Mucilaginibacter sp. BT774]
MLLLYNLGVRFYFILIIIASFFNKKAKLWANGRKNTNYRQFSKSAWFHFASLGEYEQGLPVLIAYRERYPHTKIIITFFSPSGFEIRKNTSYADAVYYLPLDTASNARKFIDAIDPAIAVFTKYEYWYHFFSELHDREIPLYIISGIFRSDQVFFKWYGGLHRKMLGFVTRFFVQDDNSKHLLQSIGISYVSVSGDTRFDRVWANAQNPKSFPAISEFIQGKKTFIGGSTWPEDEPLLAKLAVDHPDWKFIFAPHEIKEEKIHRLIELLPPNSSIRYSQLTASEVGSHHSPQTLIIDNIGMLSSLYQYGQIAYIGGGFGVGIHNTLEAAAFGLPVIFGPNYDKFKEAKDLIALQIGFSISYVSELKKTFDFLTEDELRYQSIRKKIGEYIKEHTGATEMIMGYLTSD